MEMMGISIYLLEMEAWLEILLGPLETPRTSESGPIPMAAPHGAVGRGKSVPLEGLQLLRWLFFQRC